MGHALTAADGENHRVDSATLIESRRTSPTPRFCAPTEVVLPAGARVHVLAIDAHLHDIVSRTIDEVHRQPDRVCLGAVEAAGDHCLYEVVFLSASSLRTGRAAPVGAVRCRVLIVVEEHPESGEIVLEADVTHAGSVAAVRS